MDERLAELERRLAEMERHVGALQDSLRSVRRRGRALGAAAVAAIALPVILGTASPGDSQARTPPEPRPQVLRAPLLVKDRSGRKVLEVLSTPVGGVLQLYDASGAPAVVVGTAPAAPGFPGPLGGGEAGLGMLVYDASGMPAAFAGRAAEAPGSPGQEGRGVFAFDAQGRPAAGLGALAGESGGGLVVYDETGFPAVQASTDARGGEVRCFAIHRRELDPYSTLAARLGVGFYSGGVLECRNAADTRVAGIGSGALDSGYVGTYYQNGWPLIESGVLVSNGVPNGQLHLYANGLNVLTLP